jgi:hypothetical protein
MLLWDVYGVLNDGMIGADKLRVWKQWAHFHQGVWLVLRLRPGGLNHYPGLHLLIFGVNKPYREANQEGFEFRSKASLGWPGSQTSDLSLFCTVEKAFRQP